MSVAGDLRSADAAARDRLRTDLDTSFFVEAGAGTGKTTAMVDRIRALIATGRARAESIVAITFTEAAAGELRARVRDVLESAADDETRDQREREHCREAAGRLDLASMTTIHSFAADLLRTYPLEAGLPPQLEVMDQTSTDGDRQERFRTWFDSAPGTPRAEPLQRCLQLGLRPEDLGTLASQLAEEGDLLSAETRWPAPSRPDIATITEDLGHRLAALGEPDGLPEHGFTIALQRSRLVRDRCLSAADDDRRVAALRLAERMPSVEGSQETWNKLTSDRALGPSIKTTIGEVRGEAASALTTLRAAAFCALLPHLRDWILDGAGERRRRGAATFQDLLAWARDLLRNDDVRRRCRARWSHVIVDEFQDTDPLQAELAVLLAADETFDPRTTPWLDASIVPGRLCVVGDPKQSIYRFRRADIALYERIRETIVASGGAVLTLSRNHRSAPRIIDVVNRHFTRRIREIPGAQPPYVPLHAHCQEAGDCLWLVGGELDGKAADVWAAEAAAVAHVARRAVEQGWRVRDPRDGARRAAAYQDICVLIPTRTNLRRLERAFDDAGVSYRLESGALILETQEVRELLAILRAIDDPSDQVALIAALRSPGYGCSDVELQRWVTGGGQLSSVRPGDGGVPRVAAALADLRRLHGLRHDISPPALVDLVITERMLDVAAFDNPRPREILRRLRWVTDEGRRAVASGRSTLRDVVDWLESLAREAHRADAGAAMESDEDAVRVLTVHGSKGLEFPVVVMTGLGSDGPSRSSNVLVDRLGGRVEARARVEEFGVSDRAFTTPAYDDARASEKTLEEAEHERLMYVAATRARDHLVLSLFRSSKKGRDARAWADTLREDDGGAIPLEIQPLQAPAVSATPLAGPTPEDQAADEEAWLTAREAVIAARASESRTTATQLAHEPENVEGEEPADVAALRRGRGGTARGRAVHAVLQAVDLHDPSGIDALAAAHATVEGIPDEADRVATLARRAWESEPVRRAAAGRRWRELPVGSLVDGRLVEGFIDLLYEDADGALVVVDYKTDDVGGAELRRRMEAYAVQGRTYAELLRAVTGRDVARCEFVFAATGQVVVP